MYNFGSFIGLKGTENYLKITQEDNDKEGNNSLKKLPTKIFNDHEGKAI